MAQELIVNSPTPGEIVAIATLAVAVSTTPAPGTIETWTFSSAPPSALQASGSQYRFTIDNEICIDVTAGGGTSRQIQRGAEGTTPTAHLQGAGIYHGITAGSLANWVATNPSNLPTSVGNVISGASAHLAPSGGDDTTQIANALTNYAPFVSPVIALSLGTFSITSLTATTSAEFVGSGEGTIIQQAAATNAHMFNCTTNGVTLGFKSLTINGNQANQTNDATHVYYSINYAADAAGAHAPARLEVSDVKFIDGRARDIYVNKPTVESSTSQFLVNVSNCRFFRGLQAASDNSYSAGYIAVVGGPSLKAVNNVFDLEDTPTTGRAGITTDGAGLFSKLLVANNEFRNVGIAVVGGNIGCIDSHSGAYDVVISGNHIVNAFGRGIEVKSDTGLTTITGNVVDGLTATGGATPDAQIVVNRLVHNTVAGQCTITSNALSNAQQDAITISGGSTLGAGNAADFNIADNIILTPGRRGVGVLGAGAVKVADNIIDTPGGDGVYFNTCVSSIAVHDNVIQTPGSFGIDLDGTNGTADVSITGNRIDTPVGRGIYVGSASGGLVEGNNVTNAGSTAAIEVTNTTQVFYVTGNRARGTNSTFKNSGSNTKLWVTNNDFENGLSSTAITLTLDNTGSATAWTNRHLIDTFGGAGSQNVVNLNGVPDGQIVTIAAANASHKLVVKATGGTFSLLSDYPLNDTVSTLSLRSMNGTLAAADSNSTPLPLTRNTHAARLAATPWTGLRWKETDTGLIYAYDGAAWQIEKADGHIAKTAIQTVNNSNVLVNDTELFFPIEVNETWYVEAIVQAQAASTNADFAVGWSTPAGCTMAWGVVASGQFVAVTNASTPSALKTSGSGGSFGALAGTTAVVIAGWFTADATHAGTVNFQWAQSTATAENNSILAGSILRLRRLA